MRKLIALFSALMLCGPSGAQHDFPPVTGETALRVEARGMFSELPRHGYAPVRLVVENRSGVTLPLSIGTVTEDRYGSGRRSATLDGQTLTIPPGGGSFTINTPLISRFDARYGSLRLSFSSAPAGLIEEMTQSLGGGGVLQMPTVAVSSKIKGDRLGLLDDWFEKQASAKHGRSVGPIIRADLDVMPGLWTALSGIEQLWIPASEWSAMEPDRRSAVRDWVLRGGELHLLDSTQEQNDTMVGLGQVAFHTAMEPEAMAAFMGTRTLGPKMWPGKSMAESYQSGFPLAESIGPITLNYSLLVFLMLALVIVAGPLNLFVFAGRGNRAKLFLTTPVISLLAGAVFLSTIVLQEGIGGLGERRTLVVLDPDHAREAATTEQVTRSGVLLSGSFQKDPETFLVPVPLDGRGDRRGHTQSESVEGTVDGIFRSREVVGLLLQRVRPSRGRLELLPGNQGEPHVVASTLTYDVADLRLIGGTGGLWKCDTLPAMGQATLSPAQPGEFGTTLNGDQAERVLRGSWFQERLSKLLGSGAGGRPAPGTFVARIPQAAEAAVPSVNFGWRRDDGMLVGRLPGLGGEVFLD